MFANTDLQQLLFGRFTIEQIPYHEPILQATFAPAERGRAIGAWSGLGGIASAAAVALASFSVRS